MASTQDLHLITTAFANTMDARSKETWDQVFSKVPFTWYLMKSNRSRGDDLGMGKGVVPYRGGKRIHFTVINAKNQNFKWIEKFDNLKVQTSEEETDALEVMRTASSSVGISADEIDENRGVAQWRDLLREKYNNLTMDFEENIETALIQGKVGTTGLQPTRRFQPLDKAINPLGFLIQKEFTNVDKVHGLDQVAETYWQNQALISAATATGFNVFKREQLTLYNDCAKGSSNSHPDFGVCSQGYYENTMASMVQQQRYGNFGDDEAAAAGFSTVKIYNMVMFWSDKFPDFGTTTSDAVSLTQVANRGAAFFLNSRALKLYVSDRMNMKASAMIEPHNQAAIWGKLLSRIQLILRERRSCGLHYDVVTNMTA